MSQTRTCTAENGNYVLVFPSAQWRTVSVPGITDDSTEFRYGNDNAVQLRIRRELVDADITVADLIQRQQTLDRSSLPGYLKEKVEPVAGRLRGARYAYEYVKDGKPTARGYLFPGETDFIARSLRLK